MRGCVIADGRTFAHRYIEVSLARCSGCGRWVRVLPLELLPRKQYALSLMQHAMDRYVFSERSLRKAVCDIVTPAHNGPRHSTLHRWLGGLGEKLLERSAPMQDDYPPRTSVVIAQTGRILQRDLATEYVKTMPHISPDKYHTQRRYDQLQAVARLFIVARTVAPLWQWQQKLLPCFCVPVWDFPTRMPVTPMHQALPP